MLSALAAVLAVGFSVLLVIETRREIRLRDRLHDTHQRIWAQERKELLDRIMYLADKPWEAPPLPPEPEEPEEEWVPDALDEPIQFDLGDGTSIYIDDSMNLLRPPVNRV